MLELDYFVLAGKNYLMLSNDRAAAHCRNTDFLSIALLSSLAAVIYIMILIVHCLIQAVCKGKGSSAWGIHLQVVMLLHDLHVKAGCCQNFGSILNQLQKSVDSKGHVGRFQNGDLFCTLFYSCKLLFT